MGGGFFHSVVNLLEHCFGFIIPILDVLAKVKSWICIACTLATSVFATLADFIFITIAVGFVCATRLPQEVN